MKKIVVLYHKDCPDGFSAAYAAWKKFGKRADYIAVDPRVLPNKTLKNKEIYVLDNSYRKEIIKKLESNNKSLVVIDHHLSSEKDVKSANSFVFDLKHSGAVLAWKYFHPKRKVPQFLLHVEDFDLWNFKLPHTREIDAFIELIDYDFEEWDKLVRGLEDPRYRKTIFREASLIIRHKNRLIKKILKRAQVVEFQGHKTLAVNSPLFQSEIGHILYNKKPPLGIVWSIKAQELVVSLRSNGKVDVSKSAAKFGGGGHKAAAGFSLPANAKLPWKIIKK